MNVAPGTHLGPYEILAPIGSGGMGEVWRARDTRLGRDVAIKVLPTSLAENGQLRLRLEREAKTISQLNHPHICSLYDVGDGFLVMELLEGETLADRLARGPLAVDQLLRFSIEIAGALDRAHRSGVVHRDLKPGNVMITKSGAKLLDFGLARPMASLPPALTGLTEAKPLTAEGTIVGTFQYMAPEQIEGREADIRTDIFAFGALMYEMATGRRAFDGKSKTSLIAAILDRDPTPMNELQPLAPTALVYVVGRCLSKDPDERWQSVFDIQLELKRIGADRGDEAARPVGRGARLWLAVAAALVFLSLVLAAWSWHRASAVHVAKTSFTIDLPIAIPSYGGGGMAAAPDGRSVVVTVFGDKPQLYIRRLDSDVLTLLTPEQSSRPFFSADGRWIGFVGSGGLRKVPVSGGASQLIAPLETSFLGATWLPDGTIIYAVIGGVRRISESGVSKPIILKDSSERDYRSPSALLDGSAVLLEYYGFSEPKIGILTLADGNFRELTSGGMPMVVGRDTLLLVRDGALLAARFDPKEGTLTGQPVAVADNIIMTIPPLNVPQIAASAGGLLVYARGTSVAKTLVSVDRAGAAQPLLSVPSGAEDPRLSPDGKRIAITIRSKSDTDIWEADIQRRTLTRVTFEKGEDESPVWSADGKRITYAGERGPKARAAPGIVSREIIRGLYWKPFDGSGEEETLVTGLHPHCGRWSRDGKTLFYTDYRPGFLGELWTYSASDHLKTPFLRTPFNTRAPAPSPDGRWVAYSSDESGRSEIYVRPFPGPGGVTQVSVDGGREPVWSRSGDELFFLMGSKLLSAQIHSGVSFDVDPPRLLFEANFVQSRRGAEPAFDVTPDGHFIMLHGDVNPDALRLHAETGWLDELDAKLRREEH